MLCVFKIRLCARAGRKGGQASPGEGNQSNASLLIHSQPYPLISPFTSLSKLQGMMLLCLSSPRLNLLWKAK